MYQEHPSNSLVELFKSKPYQGADRLRARFLFVGLDANYSSTIEETPIFSKLLEYHDDGVGFWRKYSVHHPFLLPEYSGDGRFYHRSFARIGFTPEDAQDVSFIELLHLPTVGRSMLDVSDLNRDHLDYLDKAILSSDARYIFLPPAVGRLMYKTGQFSWLGSKPRTTAGSRKLWYKSGHRKVFWHYHFSVYGKFEAAKTAQLEGIRKLI